MKKTYGNLKTVLIALLSLMLVFSVAFASLAVAEPASEPQHKVIEVTGDISHLKVAVDVQHLEDLTRDDISSAGSQIVSQLKNILLDQLLEDTEPSPASLGNIRKLGLPEIPSGEDAQSVLGRYKEMLEKRLREEGELDKYLSGDYDIAIKAAVAEYMEKHPEVSDEQIEKVVDEVNDIVEDAIVEEAVKEQNPDIADDPEALELKKQEVKEQLKQENVDLKEVLGETYAGMMEHNKTKSDELTETVKDIVENGAPALGIGDIVAALRNLTIGGHTVYAEEGAWNAAGVKGLLADLFDKLRAVDTEFLIEYDVDLEVSFGEVHFNIAFELVNYDGSLVQSMVNYVKDHVDFGKVDGVWTLDVRVPDVHTQLLNLISNNLSVEAQRQLFTLTDMTFEEALARVKELGVDYFLDVLKDIDYQNIFTKALDANWWASHSHDKVSVETAQRYLDAILNRSTTIIKKIASKQTVKDVEDVLKRYGVSLEKYFGGYLDGDSLGIPSQLEGLVQVILDELHELGAQNWTRADLENFLKTESNAEMVKVLNRLQNSVKVDDLFDSLINYAERGLKHIPENFRDGTLAGIVSDGKLAWAGNVSLVGSDYDSVMTKAVRKLAGWLGLEDDSALESIVTWIDNNINYEDVAVSVSATLPGISNVSYTVNGQSVRGLLIDGADVNTFAPATVGKDHAEIVAWLNENNEQVTNISGNVALHAVTGFKAKIDDVQDGTGLVEESSGIWSKPYDGEGVKLFATVDTYGEGHGDGEIANYTYQWYKDGKAIEGAVEDTYIIPGDVGSGIYYCVVTSNVLAAIDSEVKSAQTDEVSVTIDTVNIEFDAEWYVNGKPCESEYLFINDNYDITLANEDELNEKLQPGKWRIEITDAAGPVENILNAGTYTITVVSLDENYVLQGNLTLEFTIGKATVTIEESDWLLGGEPQSKITYDTEPHTLTLAKEETLNALGVEIDKTNWIGTNAGDYHVTVVGNDNVTVEGGDFTWTIEKADRKSVV